MQREQNTQRSLARTWLVVSGEERSQQDWRKVNKRECQRDKGRRLERRCIYYNGWRVMEACARPHTAPCIGLGAGGGQRNFELYVRLDVIRLENWALGLDLD